MNHRGKNGKNHEYQDSNVSASTPKIEKMMYYILDNTMGRLRTQTHFRSSFLERGDDLKYVCVRRLHYGDQIAIIYLYWQKGLSDASKFCRRGKVTLACVIGTWRVERHRETQWCPIVDCLIQIFNAFLPRMRASSVCSVSFSSTSNTNYEIKVSIYHMPHSGRHSYVQWLIAWFSYSIHK